MPPQKSNGIYSTVDDRKRFMFIGTYKTCRRIVYMLCLCCICTFKEMGVVFIHCTTHRFCRINNPLLFANITPRDLSSHIYKETRQDRRWHKYTRRNVRESAALCRIDQPSSGPREPYAQTRSCPGAEAARAPSNHKKIKYVFLIIV